MRARYESFGGVLFSEKPPFTAFVDRDYMRRMGLVSSPLWTSAGDDLSAPLEAHFNLATECPRHCAYCYGLQGDSPASAPSTAEAARILEVLARLGVFSVSFGGGEPLTRPDIFELASRARELGLTPSMTTNGLLLDEQRARDCRVFSHVHLSLDLEQEQGDVSPSFAERARLLLGQGVEIGVNFVVTRASFARLADAARLLERLKLRDVLFLRFKPHGHGAAHSQVFDLTPQQRRELFPLIQKLAAEHGLSPKSDCSLMPLVCWHRPDPQRMGFFGLEGCHGGNRLIAIDPSGQVRPCSFAPRTCGTVEELAACWSSHAELRRFRSWPSVAPEPCRHCTYLPVCRGGCHAVADFYCRDFQAPDPGCPFVNG